MSLPAVVHAGIETNNPINYILLKLSLAIRQALAEGITFLNAACAAVITIAAVYATTAKTTTSQTTEQVVRGPAPRSGAGVFRKNRLCLLEVPLADDGWVGIGNDDPVVLAVLE